MGGMNQTSFRTTSETSSKPFKNVLGLPRKAESRFLGTSAILCVSLEEQEGLKCYANRLKAKVGSI